MTITPDPSPRRLARYTPEPGEYEDPPAVYLRTAGDVRTECVPGCTCDCWHADEEDHDYDEEEWPVAPDGVTLVQITPF